MRRYIRFFAPLLIVFLLLAGCSKKNSPEGSGLKFTDPSTLEKINNAKPPKIGGSKLPASVDLSSKMPPPGNQGQQNSCVGWSIAYGMKSYQEKSTRNWEVTSSGQIVKEHVFSPAYIYNQINNGKDEGSRFQDAFNVVQSKGVASLSTDPYDDGDYTSMPNDAANSEARNFKIAWAKTIDPKDIQSIKSYLSKGYPVIIAIAFDEAFMDPKGPATVTQMQVNNNSMGHAMLIVGYDDAKSCFKIMNSWGTNWREGGFCWFTYDVFKTCIRECWIAKDMEDKKEIKKEDENPVDNNNPIVDEVLSGLQIKNAVLENNESGKEIIIKGSVKLDNNYGDNAQILVYFNYPDGKPIMAAVDDYATVNGESMGYSDVFNINNSNEDVKEFSISIPLSALNLDKEKVSSISITPYLFIDDFDATDGKPFVMKLSGE